MTEEHPESTELDSPSETELSLARPPAKYPWPRELRDDIDPDVRAAFCHLRHLIASDERPHTTIAEAMGVRPTEFAKIFSLTRETFPAWSAIAPLFAALDCDPHAFLARWGRLWQGPWRTPALIFHGDPERYPELGAPDAGAGSLGPDINKQDPRDEGIGEPPIPAQRHAIAGLHSDSVATPAPPRLHAHILRTDTPRPGEDDDADQPEARPDEIARVPVSKVQSGLCVDSGWGPESAEDRLAEAQAEEHAEPAADATEPDRPKTGFEESSDYTSGWTTTAQTTGDPDTGPIARLPVCGGTRRRRAGNDAPGDADELADAARPHARTCGAVAGLDAAANPSPSGQPPRWWRALRRAAPSLAGDVPIGPSFGPWTGAAPDPAVARAGRRTRLATRPRIQAAVLSAVAVLVLGIVAGFFSAGQDAGDPTPTAALPANPTTQYWTGLVRGAGPGGLTLRSTPAVDNSNEDGTAPEGAALTVVCGITGEVVVNETPLYSSTWLRTDDDRYLSALYFDMPGKTTLVNCDPAQPELSLMPADPMNRPATAPSASPTR